MSISIVDGPLQATTPIRFADALPEAADVIVVGAGVMGVCAALFMARTGLKVVVCEKGRVAAEQSSRNWGWIRQHGRDWAELPIMMESSRIWEEIDQQTGGKTGFSRNGVCYPVTNEKELAKREAWLDIAREHNLDTRMLTKREVDEMIDHQGTDGCAEPWIAGSFTASDARAEPWQAVPAIAELAQAEGVVIRENCAVRGLEISAGKIAGVVTEAGTVRCEQVLVAAGAWSALLLRRHGVNIPQMTVRSTACQTEPLPKVFAGCATDKRLSFRHRDDGGYTLAGGANSICYVGPDAFRHFFKYLPVAFAHLPDLSFRPFAPKGFPDAWSTSKAWKEDEVTPFEKMRVLNPEPSWKQIESIRENFAKRFPQIGKPEIRNAWAGMIDCLPDIVPIVDRVPQVDGLILATGASGHGFGIGPGFGRILASIATGSTVDHDISRFRFGRFSDGSKLEPGPAI